MFQTASFASLSKVTQRDTHEAGINELDNESTYYDCIPVSLHVVFLCYYCEVNLTVWNAFISVQSELLA